MSVDGAFNAPSSGGPSDTYASCAAAVAAAIGPTINTTIGKALAASATRSAPDKSSSRDEPCGACLAVGNKKKKCSRCSRIWYCNAACQRTDWPRHKEECQDMDGSAR